MAKKTIFILGGLLIIIIIGLILVFNYAIAPIKTDKNSSFSEININGNDVNNAFKNTSTTNIKEATTTKNDTDETADINNKKEGNSSSLSSSDSGSAPIEEKPAKETQAQTTLTIDTENLDEKTEKDELTVCTAGNFSEQFLCLINNYRTANALKPLAYNALLNTTALNHSNWMNTNNIFSHTGENDSTYTARCRLAGGSCKAENLANGFSSAQNLLEMWQNSPLHNANMLGNYTQLGLGITGKYATALFN